MKFVPCWGSWDDGKVVHCSQAMRLSVERHGADRTAHIIRVAYRYAAIRAAGER